MVVVCGTVAVVWAAVEAERPRVEEAARAGDKAGGV